MPAQPPDPGFDSSVVLLEDNLLPVEPQTLQDRPDIIHHELQTANVDIYIAAVAYCLQQMLLHVSRSTLPVRTRPAQRRTEMEIGVLLLQLLKLFAVHQTLFVAHAEDERQFLLVALAEVGMQHRTKRR